MCPTIWLYLAEIYRIQDEHPEATLSQLADGMNVSLQAASRMIRRMAEEGLIIHEPYKGFQLTPKGERIALQVLRRHRLLERFLVDVMGFGWHEVHEMTETLERGITDKLSERMAELTGHPTRCPHGEPIPSRDGVMPVVIDRPLTEWPVGEPGRVSRVKTHEPEKLIYLRDVNLVPGAPLIVTGRSPFEGPVHLEANGDRLVLGNNLASEIYVEAIEPA
ncbi:MAG TPA: metal-dependent transcriptional regulator [Aggregatilineales bacterium]|nr:metal-dependent transcriptional regulator [Chloroflexota bacterium]HOA23292.1 metal-dependent transcriptional regulator [Aggregatilineales bacterium]HPV05643.1 metal-dependent transcriptional regulator [Aggregatilineales bacterium]HQA67173.1 metal-dependent transcriptional regulator [Aggregatilineales bacterium]